MPNYLDSRVLSVRVRGVPELDSQGRVIPSSPQCAPDPDALWRNPLKIILEHKVKEKALRRMLFHDEEPTTKVRKFFFFRLSLRQHTQSIHTWIHARTCTCTHEHPRAHVELQAHTITGTRTCTHTHTGMIWIGN